MEETTVTVGYVNPEFAPLFGFEVGELIKIKEKKRHYLLIQKIDFNADETSLSTALRYKPSPKSQLRRKNYFSKNKLKLI